MAEPRRVKIEVVYDGKDISRAISDSVIEFSYTDKASGEADSIQIKVHDREGHWHGNWYPQARSKN
jgi:phage protein D